MNKRRLKREAENAERERRERRRSNTKISDLVTIVLFLSIIFGFAAAFLIMPDADSNSFETGLQRLPAPGDGFTGADYVLHGNMADDFDEYFCDQFPLRKEFVSLKAAAEVISGRAVNNGVLYADGQLATVRFNALYPDGTVVQDTEYYSKEHVAQCMDSLKAAISRLDVPVKVVLPPRAIDVIGPDIGYPTDVGDALNEQVKAALGDSYVDVLPSLRSPLEGSGKMYYSTDHHWTSTGAWYAYARITAAFGDTAHEFERYDFVTVYKKFRGTACRNGNYFFADPDEIQICRFEGDDRLKVEMGASLDYMTEKEGMYDYEALYGPDPYNFFLYGKTKYVRITDPRDAEKETLLIVKDSFAHSLAPILASNYNIVMVDLDLSVNPKLGATLDLAALAEKTGADKVLIVYNLQNVIENANLKCLTAG